MLKRHKLKPHEVDELDPDFLDELLAADRAEDQHLKLKAEEAKAGH